MTEFEKERREQIALSDYEYEERMSICCENDFNEDGTLPFKALFKPCAASLEFQRASYREEELYTQN